MKTYKTIGDGPFAYEFVNYLERDLDNDERFEGWMRGDFKNRKISMYDSVRVMRK